MNNETLRNKVIARNFKDIEKHACAEPNYYNCWHFMHQRLSYYHISSSFVPFANSYAVPVVRWFHHFISPLFGYWKQAELKLKINYYEKSGALTWAEDGENPETVISEHFTKIGVKDKELTRRRLIFFWMTGELLKDSKIKNSCDEETIKH
jgi:hypothetical protein